MTVLTCRCGAVTNAVDDAVEPCVGCAACGTTLRRHEPWPLVEPHSWGPLDRDDPASAIACRVCGAGQ